MFTAHMNNETIAEELLAETRSPQYAYEHAIRRENGIAESFETKNTKSLSEDDLNGHIVKLKTNTEEIFAMAKSGSPMSFLKEKIARRLQQNDKSALFKYIAPEGTARNLPCYNGETINLKGRLIILF